MLKNSPGLPDMAGLLVPAFPVPATRWNWLAEPLIVLLYFPALIVVAGVIFLGGFAYLVQFLYDEPIRRYLTHRR